MKKKRKIAKPLVAFLLVATLILLIVSYTKYQINAQVNLVPTVFTKQEIAGRTEITEEMLVVRKVPSDALPPNAITDMDELVGKWTANGFGIPKNSLLYDEKVLEKEQLPDSAILNLKENEVAYPLLVDLETSLGNSIIPGTKVDLYFRSKTDNRNEKTTVLYGKLASNVRVVSVKDAQATNVFENEGKKSEEDEVKEPSLASIYIFAVPQEVHTLLSKGKIVGEVVPVATSDAYKTTEDDTQMTDEEVIEYINGTITSNELTDSEEEVVE